MIPQPNKQEIDLLLQSDVDQLIEQLGLRAAVVSRDLPKSAELTPAIVSKDVVAMGIKDNLKELGRRVLRRWERSAYEILCGADPDDAKSRNDLKNALNLGEAATIGALSAAMIGMGLMPALAPV